MLIRKLFKAEMAHATVGAYTTRCHHIHGHSYRFELFLRADRPNPAMMVSDFKAVKDIGINDLFDSFDHAVMVWDKDPRAEIIDRINPDRHLVVPFNPTAEMLAKACFTVCQSILDVSPKASGEVDARVARVIVHETETGYGLYDESDVGKDGFAPVNFPAWRISDGIRRLWTAPAWYEPARSRLVGR